MAVPSHHQNQSWSSMSTVQYYISQGHLVRDASATNHANYLENSLSKYCIKIYQVPKSSLLLPNFLLYFVMIVFLLFSTCLWKFSSFFCLCVMEVCGKWLNMLQISRIHSKSVPTNNIFIHLKFNKIVYFMDWRNAGHCEKIACAHIYVCNHIFQIAAC